ncbi:putative NADPH-ferrihemoprotein reductase [Rosellinia necatrix]|uniref:Putative NADPH-ferrihemoprotein reductase n=1 Tax=Rosellinia necatrix TaxID=77044 RepID=A0A1S8AAE6_ROSNE|nr:putative NADPH-ferrihemoprotein reductase [Rosellinia necatrix]
MTWINGVRDVPNSNPPKRRKKDAPYPFVKNKSVSHEGILNRMTNLSCHRGPTTDVQGRVLAKQFTKVLGPVSDRILHVLFLSPGDSGENSDNLKRAAELHASCFEFVAVKVIFVWVSAAEEQRHEPDRLANSLQTRALLNEATEWGYSCPRGDHDDRCCWQCRELKLGSSYGCMDLAAL